MKLLNTLSGLILSLTLLLAVVLGFALQSERFCKALVDTTELPQGVAEDFAVDTMAYLTAKQDHWNASAVLAPVGIAPSEAFCQHMAEVRQMVRDARILLWGLIGLTVLLLTVCVLRRMIMEALAVGLFMPLFLCTLIGLWCVFDFEGFWYRLHTLLIPGGIFSASEPIMRLFPSGLFSSYAVYIFPVYLISVLAAIFLLVNVHSILQRRKARKTVRKKEEGQA